MLWFCSDNGPARQGKPQHVGSPGPFRAFKTSLYEGGVRVPSLLVWPAKVREHREVDLPCVTSDYFPTILAVLGHALAEQDARPYDGINLLPAIEGTMTERPRAIGFQTRKQWTLTDNRYKIVSNNRGKSWELYVMGADTTETNNLAGQHPEKTGELAEMWERWNARSVGKR